MNLKPGVFAKLPAPAPPAAAELDDDPLLAVVPELAVAPELAVVPELATALVLAWAALLLPLQASRIAAEIAARPVRPAPRISPRRLACATIASTVRLGAPARAGAAVRSGSSVIG